MGALISSSIAHQILQKMVYLVCVYDQNFIVQKQCTALCCALNQD